MTFMQTSMSAVMVPIAVSRCAITLEDHIIASVLKGMNSTMMATHAVVSNTHL